MKFKERMRTQHKGITVNEYLYIYCIFGLMMVWRQVKPITNIILLYFNTVLCWMKHPHLRHLLQVPKFKSTLRNSFSELWCDIHTYTSHLQFCHFLHYHVTILSSAADHSEIQWNPFMLATFGSIQSRPTYGNHLTLQTLNCALSLVQTYSSQGTGGWSSWKAGTWPSMNRKFKYSNQLPLQYSSVLSILVEKRWRLSGQ